MKTVRVTVTVVCFAVLGCSSPESPMGEAPDARAGGAPDGFVVVPDADPGEPLRDPSMPGPYTVGVRTIEVTDASRNRTLPVDVWYPSLDDGSQNSYELEPIASIETSARRDATAISGGWPVVIFSHGYGGIRFQSYFLTEHLASHGFVVAAPDHPGNTFFEAFTGGDEAAAQSAIDRPLDVAVTLDAILAADFLDVDASRVGISGHSFGGWTSLEAARRDDRFRVVFPMAPGFKEGATPDFVAELDRPIAIFGGSEDGTTPFDSDQRAPYELAARPKILVRITGAGHLDFSNLCEVPIAPLFVDDGCKPENIEPAVVHDRARTLATAFALRYLAGDERYDAYLEPSYALGLGQLEYWREP